MLTYKHYGSLDGLPKGWGASIHDSYRLPLENHLRLDVPQDELPLKPFLYYSPNFRYWLRALRTTPSIHQFIELSDFKRCVLLVSANHGGGIAESLIQEFDGGELPRMDTLAAFDGRWLNARSRAFSVFDAIGVPYSLSPQHENGKSLLIYPLTGEHPCTLSRDHPALRAFSLTKPKHPKHVVWFGLFASSSPDGCYFSLDDIFKTCAAAHGFAMARKVETIIRNHWATHWLLDTYHLGQERTCWSAGYAPLWLLRFLSFWLSLHRVSPAGITCDSSVALSLDHIAKFSGIYWPSSLKRLVIGHIAMFFKEEATRELTLAFLRDLASCLDKISLLNPNQPSFEATAITTFGEFYA